MSDDDPITKENVDNFIPFTTTLKLAETPWFPFTITLALPPPGCAITLHADGKWEGSIEGLRAALADGKSWGGDATARIFLWLLLRQMEADRRSW